MFKINLYSPFGFYTKKIGEQNCPSVSWHILSITCDWISLLISIWTWQNSTCKWVIHRQVRLKWYLTKRDFIPRYPFQNSRITGYFLPIIYKKKEVCIPELLTLQLRSFAGWLDLAPVPVRALGRGGPLQFKDLVLFGGFWMKLVFFRSLTDFWTAFVT